ncbi:hypothetical protein LGT39_12475 [Demequina sp. TTPB684]|uniref:hypothetical protein n=1 Tax=unclassified Demequina TaxID=2620311 RepID=UPI001CF2142E|nr:MULTISPECIES: hypothetical protein [unclassified Demequina]MCB2413660.1 hypothetical protein [Demequina sp. TTPB684]UPU87723.1 hypothetical protein LGT36_010730 [Demequina sp. TMPB413]
MPKRAAKPSEPVPHVRPRHEVLGVEPGLPGYRRGCKCTPCRTANRDRMRAWRASKKADEGLPAEVPVPPSDTKPAELILLKDLPKGDIFNALVEELPAADGAYIFQRTVSAMVRQAALLLDNADKIDRLDLISTMQIRILDGLKRLEPPRSPNHLGESGPTVEQILAAIQGDSQDGD